MKKLYIFLAAFIIIGSEVAAQDLHIGIRGGVNLSTFKFSQNDISVTPDRAAKIHFGLFFNRMISDKIAISPEILYYELGYKPMNGSLVDDIELNYVAIPIMFKFFATENINFHAGPQLGILVGGTKINDQSITEGTKPTELAFGLGGEGFLSDNVGLGARYIFGLTNTDDSGLDIDQKSNVIQLSLFVIFN